MSEKCHKEQRLKELSKDKNALAGKILNLKVYCQNHPNDARALHRLVRLIEHGKTLLGDIKNESL